jgi:predicted metal-dependent peptidase
VSVKIIELSKAEMVQIGRHARERLAKARVVATEREPYFADSIYSLVPREAWGLGTVATTARWVMSYDPYVISEVWKEDEMIAAALIHEIHHPLRLHFARRGDREPKRWNVACDLAINSMMRDAGWQLPSFALYPQTYHLPSALTPEEYYDRLPEDVGAASEVCAGNCGGAAGNAQSAAEDEADAKDGRSSVETEQIQRSTAEAIKRHAVKGGFRAGHAPGDLLEWAEAILTPSPIPWQAVLPTMLRGELVRVAAGRGDYSFARPSKRSLSRSDGVIRPGMVDVIPSVAFVVDTSGSMHAGLFSIILRECRAVLEALGVEEAWVLEVDTALARPPRKVLVDELTRQSFAGRGGTSFVPGFAACDALVDPRPELVLYLTDGQGDAPEFAPKGMDVVWVLVGEDATKPCEWGRVVWVKE